MTAEDRRQTTTELKGMTRRRAVSGNDDDVRREEVRDG